MAKELKADEVKRQNSQSKQKEVELKRWMDSEKEMKREEIYEKAKQRQMQRVWIYFLSLTKSLFKSIF